jgi:UV excision repair protein RAD23
MKVAVRTLKQEKYEFIIDENDTIDSLKTLIQEKLGHEKSWQNLIFSGTMLDPNRTIASYKITEKDFLVLLVKKPKEEPPKPAAQPAAQPTQTTAAKPPEPTTQPSQPAQPTQPSQPAKPATQPVMPQAPPRAVNEETETVIRRIMEMGFDRTQVERALQASFGHADRAVELLMLGVPIPDIQDVQGMQAMQSVLDEELDDEEEDVGEADVNQLFELMRQSPHFNNLRLLARTNPEMLEQVLTQLPPQVLEVITSNQEQFLRLLTEDPPAQGGAAPAAPAQGAGGAGGAPVAVAPRGPAAGATGQRVLNLSTEDQAIINNLVDMGFDKNRVTEAYLLFEKDADMTANYLLNHGWDDLPPGPRFTGQ